MSRDVSTLRRRFCSACGTVVRTGLHGCPTCGNTSMTTRWIRPTAAYTSTGVVPPFPWHTLLWPEGVTVAMSARFGAGKSSVAALLGKRGPNGEEPLLKTWISTEQDPNPVRAMFERLHVPCPQIWCADPIDPVGSVKRALPYSGDGPGGTDGARLDYSARHRGCSRGDEPHCARLSGDRSARTPH